MIKLGKKGLRYWCKSAALFVSSGCRLFEHFHDFNNQDQHERYQQGSNRNVQHASQPLEWFTPRRACQLFFDQQKEQNQDRNHRERSCNCRSNQSRDNGCKEAAYGPHLPLLRFLRYHPLNVIIQNMSIFVNNRRKPDTSRNHFEYPPISTAKRNWSPISINLPRFQIS